eukprot:TRINITY_DN2279_c0_g1_i1.p1 TRINITY_DN2279_c0_g1~~TRINITY_DN2279_c0_g1_i1.p1  ORF type:complete len:995 (+),score=195.93 TRINITY_DN2279_c0_g1_i1:448-2985(+)
MSVLLGDTRGRIHEARLDRSGLKLTGRSNDLCTSPPTPVSCLSIERFDNGKGYIVIATCATTTAKLFQLVGSSLENIITSCTQPNLREMPGTRSDLQLYSKSLEQSPVAFAWSTEAGILHGKMNFTSPQEPVLASECAMSFDTSSQGGDPSLKGMLISDCHFYLLHADRIQIIAQPPGIGWVSKTGGVRLKPSDLKGRTIWSKTFSAGSHNEGRGIVRDLKAQKFYIHSKGFVYELFKTIPEDNHATWKSILERAMDSTEREREAYYAIALQLCQDDPARLAKVSESKGDYYFDKGELGMAAGVYATTTKSFEETAIKFIKINRQDALLTFVQRRLEHMAKRIFPRSTQEATQMCCLTTWVVQLYLAQMNACSDDPERYSEIQEDLRDFIDFNITYVDKPTVCELMASTAKSEELLYFVEYLKDYKRVIAQYITHGNHQRALMCLIKECITREYEELWYQFSPRLIQYSPDALVSGWMHAANNGPATFLNPARLIPALMKYRPEYNPPGITQNQAIRYLKWVVDAKKNRDPAIHNMLLSQFAKQRTDADLLGFLHEHIDDYCYDLKYALRLCLAEKKHRACVHIYSTLGLYEDAVIFALKTEDVDLAKKVVAEMNDDNQALCKKLWLLIIEYVVTSNNKDVKEAISMLQESNMLELEDILPFFPDFVLIKDFKKEICESFQKYNSHTQTIKTLMDEATKSASVIKEDLNRVKYRHVYTTEGETCRICKYPVLSSPYVVFPACEHSIHHKCLLKKVKRGLEEDGVSKRDELREILRLEERCSALTERGQSCERYETEINEIISKECPFCGEMQIRETTRSFFTEMELEHEVGNWSLLNHRQNRDFM